MYEKILIAIAPDYPDTIDELIDAARALASPGAEIHALSVVSAVPTYIEIHVPKSLYQDSCKCRMKNPQKCRTKIPHFRALRSAGIRDGRLHSLAAGPVVWARAAG